MRRAGHPCQCSRPCFCLTTGASDATMAILAGVSHDALLARATHKQACVTRCFATSSAHAAGRGNAGNKSGGPHSSMPQCCQNNGASVNNQLTFHVRCSVRCLSTRHNGNGCSQLRGKGGGVIINIGSVVGVHGSAGQAFCLRCGSPGDLPLP